MANVFFKNEVSKYIGSPKLLDTQKAAAIKEHGKNPETLAQIEAEYKRVQQAIRTCTDAIESIEEKTMIEMAFFDRRQDFDNSYNKERILANNVRKSRKRVNWALVLLTVVAGLDMGLKIGAVKEKNKDQTQTTSQQKYDKMKLLDKSVLTVFVLSTLLGLLGISAKNSEDKKRYELKDRLGHQTDIKLAVIKDNVMDNVMREMFPYGKFTRDISFSHMTEYMMDMYKNWEGDEWLEVYDKERTVKDRKTDVYNKLAMLIICCMSDEDLCAIINQVSQDAPRGEKTASHVIKKTIEEFFVQNPDVLETFNVILNESSSSTCTRLMEKAILDKYYKSY